MARRFRGYTNSNTPPAPASLGHWNASVVRNLITTVGTWDVDNLSGQIPSVGNITSAAQNDYGEWSIYLMAGTYNFRVPVILTNASGIVTWTMDGGASLGTSDLYNASTAVGSRVINGIVIATPGWHTLRGTVATKNASSSAYAMRFANDFIFWKAS